MVKPSHPDNIFSQSRSVSVSFGQSWSVLVSLGQSRSVLVSLGQSQSVSVSLGQSFGEVANGLLEGGGTIRNTSPFLGLY